MSNVENMSPTWKAAAWRCGECAARGAKKKTRQCVLCLTVVEHDAERLEAPLQLTARYFVITASITRLEEISWGDATPQQ